MAHVTKIAESLDSKPTACASYFASVNKHGTRDEIKEIVLLTTMPHLTLHLFL